MPSTRFLLTKTARKKDFLFKHEEVFCDFIFYIDLQLSDMQHLIIRRGVVDASKIWVKIYEGQRVDARDLADDDWTHKRLPFERAKTLIDGLLNFML